MQYFKPYQYLPGSLFQVKNQLERIYNIIISFKEENLTMAWGKPQQTE
jgi:hypothetical protein